MRLRYTLPALDDLEQIMEALDAASPQGARRVKARIKRLVDLLLTHPLIGQTTDKPAIRRVVASPYPYLVFYEASSVEIIVHAVRHAARDPSSMPGE